jgi:hypothetical protein
MPQSPVPGQDSPVGGIPPGDETAKVPGTIPVKTGGIVKQEMKEFLTDIDVEDIQEFDEKGSWGFWVQFGEYPILIENPRGARYMVVALQVTLPQGEPVERLTALYRRTTPRSTTRS